MMLFLVHQFTRKPQSSADILNAQVVFALHFLEAHSAGEATHNDRDRRARTTNDGFTMTNGRINRNSVIHCSSRVRNANRIGNLVGEKQKRPLRKATAT